MLQGVAGGRLDGYDRSSCLQQPSLPAQTDCIHAVCRLCFPSPAFCPFGEPVLSTSGGRTYSGGLEVVAGCSAACLIFGRAPPVVQLHERQERVSLRGVRRSARHDAADQQVTGRLCCMHEINPAQQYISKPFELQMQSMCLSAELGSPAIIKKARTAIGS